jgi:hypothetical protein
MSSVEAAVLSARFGIRFSCAPLLSTLATPTSIEPKGRGIKGTGFNVDLEIASP